MVGNGHQILLFSLFTTMLDRIQIRLSGKRSRKPTTVFGCRIRHFLPENTSGVPIEKLGMNCVLLPTFRFAANPAAAKKQEIIKSEGLDFLSQ